MSDAIQFFRAAAKVAQRIDLDESLFAPPFDIPYDIVDDQGNVVGSGIIEGCTITSITYEGGEGEAMTVEPVTGLVDRVLPFF